MRCGRLARRRLERALKQVCAGHYEGWGFTLSKNSKGEWELLFQGSFGDDKAAVPRKFTLRSKAMDFVEQFLDKTIPNWRPKPKDSSSALRTYRNTVQ